MWIVELNGSDIGTIGLEDAGLFYRLRQLFIQPELHGKGIGSQAIGLVLSRALPEKEIRVHVGKNQPKAVGFYRKHGFTISSEEEEYYWMTRHVN